MSRYEQDQIPVAYPPAAHGMEGYQQGPYVMAPPPIGYPTRNDAQHQNQPPIHTQTRGDGFWKGCCAALCCCCVLDACF